MKRKHLIRALIGGCCGDDQQTRTESQRPLYLNGRLGISLDGFYMEMVHMCIAIIRQTTRLPVRCVTYQSCGGAWMTRRRFATTIHNNKKWSVAWSIECAPICATIKSSTWIPNKLKAQQPSCTEFKVVQIHWTIMKSTLFAAVKMCDITKVLFNWMYDKFQLDVYLF